MSLKLSVLDQSPISAGRTARDAFDETVALAQLAERCGYTRYWLAEHHNTTALDGYMFIHKYFFGPTALGVFVCFMWFVACYAGLWPRRLRQTRSMTCCREFPMS